MPKPSNSVLSLHFSGGARCLARLRPGASRYIQRLHDLLSLWTSTQSNSDLAEWSYDPISGSGAIDCHPRKIGQLCSSRSHCPTSDRSVAANPSMESYDSPLHEKFALPSMGLRIEEGLLSKKAQTLIFDLCGDFNQSARPLARFRVSAI